MLLQVVAVVAFICFVASRSHEAYTALAVMEALVTLLFFLLYLLKLDVKLTWLFWPLAVSGARRGGAGRLLFCLGERTGGRFAPMLVRSPLTFYLSSFSY